MISKEGDPKIRSVITEEGLESCHILGGNWKKRVRAVKLYLAMQEEIQKFQEVIKEKLEDEQKSQLVK